MERPGVIPVVDDDRIDEEILDELFLIMGDGDAGGLLTACELFLNGMPDRFVDIETALAEGRFEDAAQSAHSLRGSAGAFGARRLSALTIPLEEHCRQGNAPAAAALLEEMQGEFRIFRAVLGARLGQLSG